MRLIGNAPRKRSKLYMSEDVIDFLKTFSNDINLSVSQIVENATIEVYRQDYEEFLTKSREKN